MPLGGDYSAFIFHVAPSVIISPNTIGSLYCQILLPWRKQTQVAQEEVKQDQTISKCINDILSTENIWKSSAITSKHSFII
jgi:hypothetical protein